MPSKRRMRSIAETYRAPSRNATPRGRLRPSAMVLTWRPRPVSVSAYTLPSDVEPANTVPFFPSASPRAFGTLAHTSIENPAGNLILSSGNSGCWSFAATGKTQQSAPRVIKWMKAFTIGINQTPGYRDSHETRTDNDETVTRLLMLDSLKISNSPSSSYCIFLFCFGEEKHGSHSYKRTF